MTEPYIDALELQHEKEDQALAAGYCPTCMVRLIEVAGHLVCPSCFENFGWEGS